MAKAEAKKKTKSRLKVEPKPKNKIGKNKTISPQLEAAVEKLKSFLLTKKQYKIVKEEIEPGDLKDLMKRTGLSENYKAFIREYGFLSVETQEYGSDGIIGFFYPQYIDQDATSFQRILDDAVDEFYCFNPLVQIAQGEPEVVMYHHNQEFVLPTKKTKDSIGFEEHFILVVDDFVKTYKDTK